MRYFAELTPSVDQVASTLLMISSSPPFCSQGIDEGINMLARLRSSGSLFCRDNRGGICHKGDETEFPERQNKPRPILIEGKL